MKGHTYLNKAEAFGGVDIESPINASKDIRPAFCQIWLRQQQ